MPHKHTRKGDDKSTTDLPPTAIAHPLPTSKSAAQNGIFTSELSSRRGGNGTNKKRKRKDEAADDTPKAFQRLMAWKSGARLPKGLDDGVRAVKKSTPKKNSKNSEKETERDEVGDFKRHSAEDKKSIPIRQEVPTIRIGEKMSEFSARVDQALPLSGLINKPAKNGKDPLGLKVRRTKTERKMHRMYEEWREQDKKIKEKREEDEELMEEEAMDEDGQVRWKSDIDPSNVGGGGKKTKKSKNSRKKVRGEVDYGDDDPWRQVVRNRGEAKVGLHDVAQAPPTFTKVPSEKFKQRGKVVVYDVPKASGSLRRREELVEERLSVVEGYRAMMKSNAKANRDAE